MIASEITIMVVLAVIALTIYLAVVRSHLSPIVSRDFLIDVECPKCGAPGKKRVYGTYGQFSDIHCEYCGYEEDDVF